MLVLGVLHSFSTQNCLQVCTCSGIDQLTGVDNTLARTVPVLSQDTPAQCGRMGCP